MARWQSTEADTWGYSTNGGEWFYTGYNSHKEAFDAGCGDIDDAHPFITARCRYDHLMFDVDAEELDELFEDIDDACLSDVLVDNFVNQNEDQDWEGEAFEDAKVDDELRVDVRRDMTPEEAVSAIAAWVDRMGGFCSGRCLESFDEIEHCRDEVAMAMIVPGRREYDWDSVDNSEWKCGGLWYWLDDDGLATIEGNPYGIGLGDMQKYD